MNGNKVLIEAKNVCRDIPVKRGIVVPRRGGRFRAVNEVSLSIYSGETMALVGQSGAGKTTLGMMMLGLIKPTSGEIIFDGESIFSSSRIKQRMDCQLVFQDPLASLNPQLPIGRSIELPLINLGWSKDKRKARVLEVLEMVSLAATHAERYPHQFSGGQAQRVAIARALASNPQFIVLDEPVSALDVTIQAQIINLLKRLQETLQLTYLFIAHNINVVYFMSDRVAVMSEGRVVEFGSCQDVIGNPKHDLTKHLVAGSR